MRIFCEQFDKDVLARYDRRTHRLETIIAHLGFALGGRPASAFAHRLTMPVSNDTLLRWFAAGRLIRMAISMSPALMTLPSGAAKPTEQSFATWSGAGLSLPYRIARWIHRDRVGGYKEAIAKATPDAEQIADRWHLMENSKRAFHDAVGKSMRRNRRALGSNIVDLKLLTYAVKLQ